MKKFLILLILLLLTGCDGEYNLTITDKKEVKEKFIISVNNEDIKKEYDNPSEFLDHYSYIYSNNFKNYNIKTKKSNPYSYFIVKRNYKNLDEYSSSNSFKSMFLSADIEDTGKYVSFKTSRNDYLYNLENDMLISEDSKYDSFVINIKFYNEVVGSNADKIDKKNNIYTWYVEKKDINQSFIYFKLGPKVKYFIKIKDLILNNLVIIIILLFIIFIIAFFSIYIVFKSKKNNEI